ncbi:MAG: hypothetical protein PWP49_794 [Thermococcaceae archaeon]|nr:MAG: hypothetical protein XD43_1018 [Thermococcales archaeon 44_46]MDN5320374.1 hypothetical protein [Thermococcaceae archaeon]
MRRRRNSSNFEQNEWVMGHFGDPATHYEEETKEPYLPENMELFMELFSRAMGALFREIAGFSGSPAGIRTPVAGSKVPHAWPLHHGAAPNHYFMDAFINFTAGEQLEDNLFLSNAQ